MYSKNASDWQGERNESLWCRARAPNEPIHGQPCSASLSATREGMMVDLTSGALGKRLDRAVLAFVMRELVAPSNATCYFDFLPMRCEPSAMCHLDYQKGDMTPNQACRLITVQKLSAVEKVSADRACRWNSSRLRCENAGVCHSEVWRWVRRELQRRTWFVKRLSKLYLVTTYKTSLAAFKMVETMGLAAAKRTRVLVAAVAKDLSIILRRAARLVRHLMLKMKDPKAFRQELQATINSYTSFVAAWCRQHIVPLTKPVFTKYSDLLMRFVFKASTAARQHTQNLTTMVESVKHSATGFITVYSTQIARGCSKDAITMHVANVQRATRALCRTISELDWDQVKSSGQQLKKAAVASIADTRVVATGIALGLDSMRRRVLLTTLDTSKRWKRMLNAVKIAYHKGIVEIREARECCCKLVPMRGASTILGPAVRKLGDKVMLRLRRWRLRVRERCTDALMWLGAKGALVHLQGLAFWKQLHIERDSALESLDLCVAIPEETRASMQSWQFYSMWSVQKTAAFIRGRILQQLVV